MKSLWGMIRSWVVRALRGVESAPGLGAEVMLLLIEERQKAMRAVISKADSQRPLLPSVLLPSTLSLASSRGRFLPPLPSAAVAAPAPAFSAVKAGGSRPVPPPF